MSEDEDRHAHPGNHAEHCTRQWRHTVYGWTCDCGRPSCDQLHAELGPPPKEG